MNEEPMTPDELADLLALDALDPAEQADAELRVGTWPLPQAAATQPLAEAVATEPPADLRGQVLAAALSRRAPGRPTQAPDAIAAPVAYARVVSLFHDLVSSLDEDEATRQAHEDHGRVRDLVAHLAGIETLNLRWLDPASDVPDLPDHVASTLDVVAALAAKPWPELVEDWHRAASALLEAASNGDGRRQVRFHDLVISVDGMLTMRTFELWAHAMDIALATDRPLPTLDDEQMALMSSRLMDAVPGALLYRGVVVPDRTVRFVLTGPAGGCYDVPLGAEADATAAATTIVTDVVDLCRVAAARLAPADLPCTIEGDPALADLVLAHIDAFARD
jgi:uncharacterized protein (TIGR03083 family)